MTDLRPPLDPIFGVFGLSATIHPAGAPPVPVTGIWVLPATLDVPFGSELRSSEPRKLFALRRADAPSLPRGTRITAAEIEGGPIREWRVDGIDRAADEGDLLRVILVPA
jgi:hypothetical protein